MKQAIRKASSSETHSKEEQQPRECWAAQPCSETKEHGVFHIDSALSQFHNWPRRLSMWNAPSIITRFYRVNVVSSDLMSSELSLSNAQPHSATVSSKKNSH